LPERYQDLKFSIEVPHTLQDKTKGYYLTVKAAEEGHLDQRFLQRVRKGQKVHCTTKDLRSLNQQLKESLATIMTLSHKAVQELLRTVREEMGVLYAIADSVSLLDVLMSFATTVMLTENWQRPSLGETDSPIAIQKGRHPVLEACSSNIFCPNDTFLQKGENLQIITGPNMAGKSTYLRQVALICVLAHMGSYVPADFAQLRITDRLILLSGNDASDLNTSSFMAEMRSTAFILQHMTNQTLLIVDEVGRGTSSIEGAALSWAICEEILSSDAYCLFATHHTPLAQLGSMYASATNLCFSMALENEGSENADQRHTLSAGSCTEVKYGITLAASQGMDRDVIVKAQSIAAILLSISAQEEGRKRRSEEEEESASHELASLLLALPNSTLSDSGLRGYLRDLKARFF